MKKGQLYRMGLEIGNIERQAGFGYLLRGRIMEFYKQHGLQLQGVMKQVQEVEKKYFIQEENGQYKLDENKNPVLIEGMVWDEYTKELNELFDKDVTNIQLVTN